MAGFDPQRTFAGATLPAGSGRKETNCFRTHSSKSCHSFRPEQEHRNPLQQISRACLAKVYPMAWTKSEKPSLSPDGIRSKAGAPKHFLGITGAVDLDGAGHGLNLIKIVGCECDGERPQILIQAVERPRTKQGDDP